MTENQNRSARFETFEPRLVMSAQALTDIVADFQVDGPPVDIDQQIEVITQSVASGQQNGELQSLREQYDLDGNGQTIAVIDSGIAFDHVAFGGGLGDGHKVVGGYDFAEQDHNPYDDGPVGLHGTHVAGIIGGESEDFAGIAPAVDLVSLRVFDDYGYGELDWVEQALQWVHDNRDAFENPITTVNLSLGTDWNASTLPDTALFEDEFAQLKSDGIFVSVAAGNLFENYNDTGLSYPAASPFVVPVASHDADGNVSDFSQRNDRVLVAPGENILSTVPDHVFAGSQENGYLRSSGTSQSAPYVAGASALLREAFQDAGVENIDQDLLYEHFRETADIIHDQATGGYFHKINLARAIETAIEQVAGSGQTQSPDSTFHVQDGVLYVNGTGQNDNIQFQHGQVLNVAVNGQHFSVNSNTISQIIVTGEGGTDSISATFNDQVDRAVLQKGRLSVAGPSINFVARGFETINLDGGENADRLVVRDSSGNDDVTADFNSVSVSGADYNNTATGFTRVVAKAGEGFDRIYINGSEGDDRFIANDGRNVLRGAAGRIVGVGFENTTVIASGGNDIAHLYDSTGNDQFKLDRTGFHIDTDNYKIWGGGFERSKAFSRSGYDVVVIEGSDSADRLVYNESQTRLQSDYYLNIATGFEQSTVWAHGGQDAARILDSSGNDSFHAERYSAQFETSSHALYTEGFNSIVVNSSSGGIDSAFLTGTEGIEFVSATESSTTLHNSLGVEVTVRNFDQVSVDTLGGYDNSSLLGGAGNDLIRSIENGIEYESTVQMLRIVQAENHHFDGGGGVDEAIFSDFDSLDLLDAIGDGATAYINSQEIAVGDIEFLEARVRAGQTGFYEIDAVDFLYLLDGDWEENNS